MTPHTETQAMCERLEAIQRRVDAATEGPWNVDIDDTGGPFTLWPSVDGPEDADETIIHRAGFKQEFWEANSLRRCKANAEFIANAREDVPYLLALLTRQQEEIDRLREAAKGSAVIVNTAKEEVERLREDQVAARFNRLLGICHKILWADFGKPSLKNEQTAAALGDLCDFLFLDAFAELSDAALQAKP